MAQVLQSTTVFADQLPDEDLDDILEDLNGHITGPVSGLLPKYFARIDTEAHTTIQKLAKALPAPSINMNGFIDWFLKISDLSSKEMVDVARGTWHICRSSETAAEPEPSNSTSTSLVLAVPEAANSAQAGWADVRVVGQFYQHPSSEYRDGFLRLYSQARQVFSKQPTRLFLHGFYLRGPFLELWVFDRSGAISGDVIHVRDSYLRFLSVLVGYRLMTDEELGNGNIIETDGTGRTFITPRAAASPVPLGKLLLEDEGIVIPEDIVGEGTTCYRVKRPRVDRWEHVVKFKWRLASDRPEEELLRFVNEKNVLGVIHLDFHEEITSTLKLRQGLQCGNNRIFPTTQNQNQENECSKTADQSAVGITHFTQETDMSFENRVLTCIMTSPAGRSLHTFKTTLELLQVFRDAIMAHRSLYQDAGLLHRDISANNIIITDPQGETGDVSKGILIDFDVAVQVDVGATHSAQIIGTRPFMAIGVLKGRRHTYRHDLESFLYVFLWTVICGRAQEPLTSSKLRLWRRSSNFEELADIKMRNMEENNFQDEILSEFPLEFDGLKLLAENLRRILFPKKDGVYWTGTEGSRLAVDGLYDAIIGAFEDALDGYST